MPKLGAAVDANTTVFEFGSAVTIPGKYPARYTIDDEAVYVTGGSGTRFLSVVRGADDTVAASHAVNADFDTAPTGEQKVSLLGPVNVPYNHPDISGNFGMVRIAELTPGATVVRTWAVMRAVWNVVDMAMHIAVSDTSDGNSTIELNVIKIDLNDVSSSPAYDREITTGFWGGVESAYVNYVGRAGNSGAWLLVYFGPGSPTAGEADVYALIAEPS